MHLAAMPEYRLGPLSKWYPSCTQACAAPPGMAWLSHTVTCARREWCMHPILAAVCPGQCCQLCLGRLLTCAVSGHHPLRAAITLWQPPARVGLCTASSARSVPPPAVCTCVCNHTESHSRSHLQPVAGQHGAAAQPPQAAADDNHIRVMRPGPSRGAWRSRRCCLCPCLLQCAAGSTGCAWPGPAMIAVYLVLVWR